MRARGWHRHGRGWRKTTTNGTTYRVVSRAGRKWETLYAGPRGGRGSICPGGSVYNDRPHRYGSIAIAKRAADNHQRRALGEPVRL